MPLCVNNLYINSLSRLIPDMCPLSRYINSAYIVKIYTFSNTKCFLKVGLLYSNVVFMYRLIATVVLVSCEFVLPLGRLFGTIVNNRLVLLVVKFDYSA